MLNKLQQMAFDLIVNSRQNVLLTGNAGTGKSFTINAVVKALKERGSNVQVCASTALAATAIGGKTLHSALAIYPMWGKPGKRMTLNQVIEATITQPDSRAGRKIRQWDVIIIDEVSMIHIVDLIRLDAQLKAVHKSTKPFGGVQMVFVGDFLQLEPVHNAETAPVALPEGQSPFCFESKRAWGPANIQVIQLEEIVRQQDKMFATFLNNVRCGIWHPWMQRIVDERTVTEAPEGVPFFLPTNQEVDAINEREMAKLPGQSVTNMAWDYNPNRFVNGQLVENTDYWDKNCLALNELTLKVGARVICLTNSPRDAHSSDERSKLPLVNGDMGTVTGFYEQFPVVLWDRLGYEMTPGVHTFSQGDEYYRKQIPVKPCWALTVHKSQGMTLDSACVDLGRAFATGQVYVALSRVRTLDGLYIKSLDPGKIKAHPKALEFYGITGNYVGDDENGPDGGGDGGNDIGVPPNSPDPSNPGPGAIVSEPQIRKEDKMTPAAPPAALIKRELLSPEVQDWLRTILENEIAPILVKDVSSYAPGRMRTWMPYEAPLDTAVNKNKPFVPGILHDDLWQWIVDLCDKWGMRAQTALISKGGNIKAHRDTTYAAEWAFGINLGACEWGIASERQSAIVDYVMELKGGEVFSFNSKHVHRVENAAPDRWAINVWAIADTNAARNAHISERIEEMLGKNPDLDDFIRRHQPGAQAIADVPQVTIKAANPTNNQTEENAKPMIYHWIEQSDVTDQRGQRVINHGADDSDMVMVITNMPTPDRKQAFHSAEMGVGSTVYKDNLWLAPIDKGSWRFHYLERLSADGLRFTIKIRRLNLMMMPYSEGVTMGEHLSASAHLSWVDNKNLYLMTIEGAPLGQEFDWSLIGLEVNDSKKMVKRMAEVLRMSASMTDKNLKVLTLAPEHKSNDPDFWVKAFDGKNIVKWSSLPKDLRARLNRKGFLHVMGRGWTSAEVDGAVRKVLVKGDYVVVPDYQWKFPGYDVVAHAENLKTEVVTIDDRDLWTFWEHAPLHVTTWDQQTLMNYPSILPIESMKTDYLYEMNDIDAQLAKGLLPGQVESDTQVQAADEGHDEFKNLLPTPDEIEKNRELAKLVGAANMDIKMFENLIGLSVNGFVNSKARTVRRSLPGPKKDPIEGMHDKHVVTMRNSFRATCVTDTFLRHFCDVRYTTHRIAFFDKNFGMIWNGEHFCRTFELHGTHDKDDTHFFLPIKIWSSDPTTVAKLKECGVMLPNIEVPATPDQAILVLAVFRIPNGAGEYSIMEFDFSTWPNEIPFDESLVRTHNLSFNDGWVRPMPMVAPANMPGLPTGRIYSKSAYTKENFLTDLTAQYENPMFGAMCNALVTYSYMTGGNIPACMIDSLGNVVDATQQGADIVSFTAINKMMTQIREEIVNLSLEGDIKFSKYFYHRRGSVAKKAVAMGQIELDDQSEIDCFDAVYKNVYEQLRSNIQRKYSFWMRREVPINAEVLNKMSFTPEQIAWAKSFILNMGTKLAETDNMIVFRKESSNKFTKPVEAAARRKARHQIVDEAIASIEGMKDPRKAILCLWYTLLKPRAVTNEGKYGHKDRVMCQAGSERSLAHLLLQALIDWKEEQD